MKAIKNTYVKDRDKALLSLDEQQIRAFCKKYKVHISDNPVIFWAGVYKAILAMKKSPEETRKKAEDWLDAHGFRRGIEIEPIISSLPEKQERYARHTFEHVVFPRTFYDWGDKILNQVIDGDRYYMADLYSTNVECDGHALQSYKSGFFKVTPKYFKNGDEEITIVRLELPKPVQITECRRIYLCLNKASKALMYFTSELSMGGTYYLCAWTKQHSHIMLNANPQLDEFDNVAGFFREFAGYEPSVEYAV